MSISYALTREGVIIRQRMKNDGLNSRRFLFSVKALTFNSYWRKI
jgi:hypothetical protein